MAKENTDTTTDIAEKSEIDKLVDQIGIEAGDDATTGQILAKGMSDALGSMVELVKGKGPNNDTANVATGDNGVDDDDDEKLGDGEGGDEDMGGEGAASGGAGFTDMDKGGNGDEFVDATEFVISLQNDVKDLTELRKADAKAIAGLEAKVQAMARKQDQFIESLAAVLTPMSKGIADTHQMLLDTPARAVGDGHVGQARKKHTVGGGEGDGTVVSFAPHLLAKGLQSGVFTEDQFRLFKATQAFDADAAVDKDIKGKISALAS